jgi:hypothetical protein
MIQSIYNSFSGLMSPNEATSENSTIAKTKAPTKMQEVLEEKERGSSVLGSNVVSPS